LADTPAAADDGLTVRLKAAGAIVIGKTNVPMFGLGSHTTNPVYGPTRNPHDPARTPGGSSGGAAAALATGMLALADGSDMMGSLRNPAAWCDVYGFRPTVGLVPGEPGTAALTHRLSTLGPMARDISDLEALLVTLSDGVYRPAPDLTRPSRALRIGWLGDWGGAFAMEAGILDLAQGALARMADLGWQVVEVAPPYPAEALWQAWTDLRSFAVAMAHADLWRDPAARAALNAQAAWEIERGLDMSGARLAKALALREGWLAALPALWEAYDALVLPATQVWPFPVEWDWPREIAGRMMDTYHRWMEVVVPASLAGLPAAGLPAGFGDGGLPGGVQLIGPAGADARLLSMARAYAAAIGPRALVTP
jgi:amidase